MKIKRINLDSIEAQIITGIIVSTDYLRKVRSKLKQGHLKTVYGDVLINWCFKYFDDYRKAPTQDIQRIYRENKDKLSKEKAKLVGNYLDKLSQDYEKQSKYNVDYTYDQTLDYIRRRDLENLADKIKLELDRKQIAIRKVQAG